MNIKVTKIQVSVTDKYVLNDKEYNVNKCYFTFSEEYTDNLVKKAIFKQNGTIIEEPILNNECMIPSEVLNRGTFELRVYAYEVEDDELILRYSPTPTIAYVRSGSYIEGAESPEVITPSQFEQYMQAMNDGLVEVQNVDIDAEQLTDGIKVTITNRYDEEKEVFVSNGEEGPAGPQGPEGPAGRDGYIQYTAGENITIENNVISAVGGDGTTYIVNDSSHPFVFDGKKKGTYVFNYNQPFYYKVTDSDTTKQLSNTYLRVLLLTEDFTYIEGQSEYNNLGVAWYIERGAFNNPYRRADSIKISGGTLSFPTSNMVGEFVTQSAQRFIGVKTFSDIPKQLDSTAPTQDTEFTNKKYVDDSITTVVGNINTALDLINGENI